MPRNLIIIAAAAIALVGIVLFTSQPDPEPTPQERLQQAAEDAKSALEDAGDALADSARETGEAVSQSVQESVAELAEALSAQTQSLSAEALELLKAWEDAGIVTDDGLDFAMAREILGQSQIAQGTKDKVEEIFQKIEETPENIAVYLAELQSLLTSL